MPRSRKPMLKMTTNNQPLSASFRDPSGFLFERDGVLYRQVNQLYQPHYDQLMQSGLYERLVKAKRLIPHQEVSVEPLQPELAYKVIQPERLAFISYPYEWSFSQLKDAALLTLKLQKRALEYGMWLKDASAYNIQFHQGRPVLIDTLSFERYPEGQPWVAYRQFCQHFLAPLALMAYRDVRLNQLLRVYIDGVPLDLASRLLPWHTRLNFGLSAHIHLHAAAQQRYSDKAVQPGAQQRQVSKMGLIGLIDSLENTVRKLKWQPAGTEWGDYYDATNYTRDAFEQKKQLVDRWIEQLQPAQVWDLGANTGVFSRLASDRGIFTVAADIDPAAVDKSYQEMRQKKETCLHPLLIDLTNPSPALGWHNQERDSLIERGPVDLVLALALVHHLAISNNVPLVDVARFFAHLGRSAIVEFVPKSDSQVQRLLSSRVDIFPNYTREGFEAAFGQFFTIRAVEAVEGSQRLLYLLGRKN